MRMVFGEIWIGDEHPIPNCSDKKTGGGWEGVLHIIRNNYCGFLYTYWPILVQLVYSRGGLELIIKSVSVVPTPASQVIF